MNKENTEKLLLNFPKLFGEEFKQRGFYFECDNGWFELVYDALNELNNLDSIRLTCIKEKFGFLNIYYIIDGDLDCIDIEKNIIKKYTIKSMKICEVCGNPGEKRRGMWIKTLCDDCEEKRNERF